MDVFELEFSESDDNHGNCLKDLPSVFTFIPYDNFKLELVEDDEETIEKEPDWLSLPSILFKKENFLGGGMWGSVFSCSFVDTNEQVIVKVANRHIYQSFDDYSVRDEVNALVDEANTLKLISHLPQHSHIIFPTFINQGYILIRTKNGLERLPSIILKCPIGKSLTFQPEIPIDKRKEIAKEITMKIIEALRPVHELGYLHGDISPSNLLMLDEDFSGKFVLIDWGLSNHYTYFDYIDYDKKVDDNFVQFSKSTFLDYRGISELWSFIVFGDDDNKDDYDYIEIEKCLDSWYFLTYHELLSLNISSII